MIRSDSRLRPADPAPAVEWLLGSSEPAVRYLTRRDVLGEDAVLDPEESWPTVCSRLGMVEDPHVESLARSLVDWQLPDGGWNCDPKASGRRSSFHETLTPAWGLHEYAQTTGAAWAARRLSAQPSSSSSTGSSARFEPAR